jgi:hypothetical protein
MPRYLCCLFLLFLACDEYYAPDTTPPRVVATAPADSATVVPTNSAIRIHFSESMIDTTVPQSFTFVSDHGGSVLGECSWPSPAVLVFTPTELLRPQEEHRLVLGISGRDRSGNTLAEALYLSFTTCAGPSYPKVWMFGRSVLESWFYHWGWSGDAGRPVARRRFTLYHRYLESPVGTGAQTVADFRQQVAELNPADSPVVFVKLCFVDFEGGDSATAAENLARNTGLMAQFAACVLDTFGYRLILGNALPKTASEHDQWLGWNHARYNASLDSLAAARPGRAFVLDLYRSLAQSGRLRSDYATGTGDAHPNSLAYDELDLWLDDLLERNF